MTDQHRVILKVATIPPPAKDVDELLRLPGGDARYEQMIAEAKPFPAWMIDHIEDRGHDLATPHGKQDAAEDMVATLTSLPAIERGEYVKRFAVKLGIPLTDLRAALNECWKERVRAGTAPSLGSGQDVPVELLRVDVS